MNIAAMKYNSRVQDMHDPHGRTCRLALAVHRFQRKAQYPNGEVAFKIGAIRRLETKLGRAHRF